MASGQWVPKAALIDQIRRIMIDGESGAFTILTDKRRSIMFRFSEGKLIHSHCRSRDVNDAITAINECAELKFSQSSAQPKDQNELIAAEAFLQAVAPDESIVPAPVVPAAPMANVRPLVEKVERKVERSPEVRSEAFSKRIAELGEGDSAATPDKAADAEAPDEEQKTEPDHRLFF